VIIDRNKEKSKQELQIQKASLIFTKNTKGIKKALKSRKL
jgi:hypothetical protein